MGTHESATAVAAITLGWAALAVCGVVALLCNGHRRHAGWWRTLVVGLVAAGGLSGSVGVLIDTAVFRLRGLDPPIEVGLRGFAWGVLNFPTGLTMIVAYLLACYGRPSC